MTEGPSRLNMRYNIIRRGSFALNIALVLALAAIALRRQDAQPATSLARAPERPPSGLVHNPHYPEAAPAAEQRRWLVDQLRSMGMPNDILARVVIADLDAVWTKRSAEIAIKNHGDPDTMAALQMEVDKGMDDAMRDALGEKGFLEWDRANMSREINLGEMQLGDSERDSLYRTWKELQKIELDLKQAHLDAELDDAEIGDLREKVLSSFNLKVRTLLGEERYKVTQGTAEGAALQGIKSDPGYGNLSDDQFRELVKAQQQFNDLRKDLDKRFQDNPSSPLYAEEIKALDAARDEECRQALGAEAFDALQKSQNLAYANMKKHADLWGLNDANIDYVYSAMKYYEKGVQDYLSQVRTLEAQGKNVDWEAVDKNLDKFSGQTSQSLQSYLGPERFERLQRNQVLQLGGASAR